MVETDSGVKFHLMADRRWVRGEKREEEGREREGRGEEEDEEEGGEKQKAWDPKIPFTGMPLVV